MPKAGGLSQLAQVFFPPELSLESEGVFDQLGHSAGVDAMKTLYLKKLRLPPRDESLDRKLVSLVVNQARSVVAHPARPTLTTFEDFKSLPFNEIALEETLEDNPWLSNEESFLVESNRDKRFSCVMMLDASASMSGEKHLLGSIAVAVLLLQVPPRDTSVILFSSAATAIKNLSVDEPPERTVLRFLREQPRGFTNISAGLEMGFQELARRSLRKRRVGLLVSDGRTTEGKSPVESASKYDYLVVLHLHGPGSHLEASQEMAHHGHGTCLEVERFEELPYRLYDALRLLARL